MAPAPRLIGLALAVAACAATAPWAPHAVAWSAALALLLAGIAAWDGKSAAEHTPISLIADDGTPLSTLRLIEGRPIPLRLGWQRWPAPRLHAAVTLALMPVSIEFAAALEFSPVRVQLAPPAQAGAGAGVWTASVTGRARGRFRGLRCGCEQLSRLGLWHHRQWQSLDCEFLVYPDLAPGRRALLRSPVYRALSASALLPLTGQGREFERLREYQSGDTYADLSWKATARRAFPVTRLYQWEQQQEIYFLLDHSRLSRPPGPDGRPHLETFIATALVAATAATEVGDHYGLITFAGDVTHWIAASSGRAHFSACRECLLGLEPSAETPDYNALMAAVKTSLRRRCYLLLLANLTERGLADNFSAAARLVSRTHLILAHSLLPPAAQPLPPQPEAAAPSAPPRDDVFPALAGALESRRIAALRPQLALAGIQFRAVPSSQFLPAALAGYLESKQAQRL